MSERETVVELPFAADCYPCEEKLRTVLPFTVGIRDGAVQLVSTLGSAVISARAELGSSSITTSALPVTTMLTCQCVAFVSVRVCAGGGGCGQHPRVHRGQGAEPPPRHHGHPRHLARRLGRRLRDHGRRQVKFCLLPSLPLPLSLGRRQVRSLPVSPTGDLGYRGVRGAEG